MPRPTFAEVAVITSFLPVARASRRPDMACLKPTTAGHSPQEMDPPLGLIFAGFSCNLSIQCRTEDGVSSSISKISTTSSLSMHCESAFEIARQGPTSFFKGPRPVKAAAKNLARIGCPSDSACERFMRRSAAPCGSNASQWDNLMLNLFPTESKKDYLRS